MKSVAIQIAVRTICRRFTQLSDDGLFGSDPLISGLPTVRQIALISPESILIREGTQREGRTQPSEEVTVTKRFLQGSESWFAGAVAGCDVLHDSRFRAAPSRSSGCPHRSTLRGGSRRRSNGCADRSCWPLRRSCQCRDVNIPPPARCRLAL